MLSTHNTCSFCGNYFQVLLAASSACCSIGGALVFASPTHFHFPFSSRDSPLMFLPGLGACGTCAAQAAPAELAASPLARTPISSNPPQKKAISFAHGSRRSRHTGRRGKCSSSNSSSTREPGRGRGTGRGSAIRGCYPSSGLHRRGGSTERVQRGKGLQLVAWCD